MICKQAFIWLTLPFRMAMLITPSRLSRLWYYLRINQPAIIFDRVKRLLKLGTATPMPLYLYSASNRPGIIVFPTCETPIVSIIVPVYNHWDTTLACLVAICENTFDISYEVIVADDGSQDDTRRLAERVIGAHHIINAVNLGFLRNCNHAALHARGKYLVLLNNDTQVQPDWLNVLVKLAEQDESVGIAGPMLLYPDGHIQEAGGIIWRDGSGWNYGRLDYPERPEYNYLKETDYISGACILIRKCLWDEIGGFDERFAPAYYEDTDLAFEVRRRGYRVLYQPMSRVVHQEGVSHGIDTSAGVKSRQTTNKAVFREKWAAVLDTGHGRDPRDLFRARDRSLQKKRLLFIDHYVPLRDQDAGSKSAFQYLALMAEMGYQVTFLGDNFVDYQPYTLELQQMGIEVLYGSFLQSHWKSWLEAHGKDFDYVWLCRPHITRKYLLHVRRHSPAKLLYFGHDLNCLREERHYQLVGKRADLALAKKWTRWEEDIMRQVDMSYFFSTFEVAEVRRRFPGVTVRATPLYLFDEQEIGNTSSPGFADREGLLFVGGFMHLPNIDAVCWFAEEVLPLVRVQLPEVVFTVAGSNPPPNISRLHSDHVHVVGRISDDALLQYYRRTRLVVAPLRFGAGVKGKIIEAMRYGVPVVTTSVGAEGIGDSDRVLLIADEAEAFARTVVRAYSCKETWENTAFLSHEALQKHFSKETARGILLQDMPL